MLIAEIFHSIQGEGRLVGVPSAFIRTSGCNLRCVWCDTPYTSWNPEGTNLSVDEILQQVERYETRHVVVTGGEPLIAPGIESLCEALRDQEYHITVETAATVFKEIECDLASLSPKLSNSTPHPHLLPLAPKGRGQGEGIAEAHERLRLRPEIIQQFMDGYDYQLKFVIDKREDVTELLAVLEQLGDYDPEKVLLMPQGVTVEDVHHRGLWIADECKKHGFRFCPRLHIELYGNKRGT